MRPPLTECQRLTLQLALRAITRVLDADRVNDLTQPGDELRLVAANVCETAEEITTFDGRDDVSAELNLLCDSNGGMFGMVEVMIDVT